MRHAPRKPIDVLAVDDDRDTTDEMAEVLTCFGYRVSIADNGIQALEFISRNPLPRLIIIGLFTAGMGGVEFLSYRKGSKWENVPLVILADVRKPPPLPGWAEQILPRQFDMHQLLSVVRNKLH